MRADLTSVEMAARLNVSAATLARRIADGTAPPSYKIGKLRRFPEAAFEDWLAKQQAALFDDDPPPPERVA